MKIPMVPVPALDDPVLDDSGVPLSIARIFPGDNLKMKILAVLDDGLPRTAEAITEEIHLVHRQQVRGFWPRLRYGFPPSLGNVKSALNSLWSDDKSVSFYNNYGWVKRSYPLKPRAYDKL